MLLILYSSVYAGYVNVECDTANRWIIVVAPQLSSGKSCTPTLEIILLAHVTAIGGIPFEMK